MQIVRYDTHRTVVRSGKTSQVCEDQSMRTGDVVSFRGSCIVGVRHLPKPQLLYHRAEVCIISYNQANRIERNQDLGLSMERRPPRKNSRS